MGRVVMMNAFPLRGVIGLIAHSAQELDHANENGLQCVEIRADLLLDGGLSLEQLMAVVSQAKRLGLACLFTLRHPSHGGKFSGDEQSRAAISEQALAAGADIVDLEWRSDAARLLLAANRPLILSHHDFNAMPTAGEFDHITAQMQSRRAIGIKLVPSAANVADSVRMLEWVSAASDSVARIGFAMGAAGACSRILTLAYGAPITYASFGEPVAPGQVALDDLLHVYRVANLGNQTRVVAIVGSQITSELTGSINQRLQAENRHCVAVPFPIETLDELVPHLDSLRIDAIVADQKFLDSVANWSDCGEIIGASAPDGRLLVLEISRLAGVRKIAARRAYADTLSLAL